MKLFRMRTMSAFGLGFLAGSRAGRGPWEKAEATFGELKGKVNGGSMGGNTGSTSSNGFEGQYDKTNPRMTEV
ncbi:MAG TPA: hypothetical protein VGO87_01420 [Acidimicrobiia bacterium]|jgi:hypothetical protein